MRDFSLTRNQAKLEPFFFLDPWSKLILVANLKFETIGFATLACTDRLAKGLSFCQALSSAPQLDLEHVLQNLVLHFTFHSYLRIAERSPEGPCR
jgi:hypothetical protein